MKIKEKIEMVLLGFLVLVGVGIHIPTHHVDPELVPYVQRYYALIDSVCPKGFFRNPKQVSITITKDLEGTIIGQCRFRYNGATILIDEGFWKSAPENQKYSVMMHEMTHCFMTDGILAAFPYHVDNPYHYMYAYNNNMRVDYTDIQLLDAAIERCAGASFE